MYPRFDDNDDNVTDEELWDLTKWPRFARLTKDRLL